MAARRLALLCSAVPVLALGQVPAITSIDFGSNAEDTTKKAPAHHRHAVAKARRDGALTLRARSIAVEGPWADGVDLGIAVCDVVTPEKIFAAMEALEAAITRSPAAASVLGSQGAAEVLLVQVDYDTRPGAAGACGDAQKTVGLAFRPFHVRADLVRLGDNALPLPRAPFATIYENVPAPLRALNPQFGVSQDKAFGTAATVAIGVSLPAPGGAAKDSDKSPQQRPLSANLQRVQSTRNGYFRNDADLSYHIEQHGSVVQEYRLRWGGSRDREPLAGAEQSHDANDLGLGLTLKPAPRVHLFLDMSRRTATDDLTTGFALPSHTETRRLSGRALVDALDSSGAGFVRGALWHEAAHADGTGSFTRTAAQAGYVREMSSGSGPTWGLELRAGVGWLSSSTPQPDRFFGGSAAGQFLYDAPGAATALQMPRGPLIRSFGQGQAAFAGQRGGSRYWHLNANLALPIRPWSYPLIPDEPTELEDAQGKPVSVKDLLRRQVDVSAPSMLAATLMNQGMSADEAQRQAKTALDEVTPAVHFLVDRASLFAVRPLLLLDVAGLSDNAGAGSARWVAVGAGVGITVITARLEAGYMQTVSGPRLGGGRGAGFVRLVFQNLF